MPVGGLEYLLHNSSDFETTAVVLGVDHFVALRIAKELGCRKRCRRVFRPAGITRTFTPDGIGKVNVVEVCFCTSGYGDKFADAWRFPVDDRYVMQIAIAALQKESIPVPDA